MSALTDDLGDRFRTAASGTPASSSAPTTGRSKFTVLLSPEDAAELDALVLRLRRRLGRRVDKSEVVRAWIGLTAADPALTAEVQRAVQSAVQD